MDDEDTDTDLVYCVFSKYKIACIHSFGKSEQENMNSATVQKSAKKIRKMKNTQVV